MNIETVFRKFLDDGKLTIRLRAPAVDLAISKAGVVGRVPALSHTPRPSLRSSGRFF